MNATDVTNPELSGKSHIAIVAGNARQRSILARCLTSFYQFAEYPDVAQAVAGCRAHVPLLALVSEQLPPGGGFDLVRRFRLDPGLASIPVVILAGKDDKVTRDGALQCGADSLLVEPFSRSALVTTVSGLLNRGVERKWKTLRPLQRKALSDTLLLFNGISNVISEGKPIPYQGVSSACQPLVEAVANDDFKEMLDGVKDHDNYSFAHSMRVATYLTLFGCHLRLPKEEQILLASGGLLHDIGKMSIPHEVLNKPGRLNDAERAVMEGHVTASVAYLDRCQDLPKGIITIAAQHHEKVDGTGYPLGLAGSKLNRLARIACIIDIFTALTDRRVYKPPIEAEAALKFMVDEMDSQLDPKLLGLFRQMLLDTSGNIHQQIAHSA